MTKSKESEAKELKKAIQLLQRTQDEQYESLKNEFSNRAESQCNLMKYLFQKYQIMKEVLKALTAELAVEPKRLDELWKEAKEKCASSSIEDEMVENYSEELGKDNG